MSVTKAGATRDAVFEALLEELQAQRNTQTEYIATLRSQVVNHVLLCEVVQFPAEGFLFREFRVPMGSVAVANHSAGATVLVQASGPAGDVAPDHGPAMGRVGPGSGAVLNLTGHVLTLYGPPGGYATVQVFTRPQPPNYGVAQPALAGATSAYAFTVTPGAGAVVAQLPALPAGTYDLTVDTQYGGAPATLDRDNQSLQVNGVEVKRIIASTTVGQFAPVNPFRVVLPAGAVVRIVALALSAANYYDVLTATPARP